nr:MAG TPA: hypothetical protein [Caudoviricetes sp.]
MTASTSSITSRISPKVVHFRSCFINPDFASSSPLTLFTS